MSEHIWDKGEKSKDCILLYGLKTLSLIRQDCREA